MNEALQQKYLASFNDKIELMEQALAGHDRQVLIQKVHQLAGSSGSYGYETLSACCTQIEEMLMSDDCNDDQLVELFEPLLTMMKELCSKNVDTAG